VQEFVLSPLSTCHCGGYQIDLQNLLRAATWLYSRIRPTLLSFSNFTGLSCALAMSYMADPALVSVRGPPNLPMMMRESRRFKKTEPRDSIYGVLGLIDRDEIMDTHHATLLEVDYSKPLPDVLRDATRYGFCQNNDMCLLKCVHHPLDISAADKKFTSWTIRVDLARGNDWTRFSETYTANAGLGTPTLLGDMSHGADILLTEGFVIDTVLETGTSWNDSWDDSQDHWIREYRTWLRNAKEVVLRRFTDSFPNDGSRVYSFMASTLTAGLTRNGQLVQPTDTDPLSEYLEKLIVADGEEKDDENDASHVLRGESREDGNGTALVEIVRHLRLHYCIDRRFFVTKDGRMGLGPHGLLVGDIIAILRGASMPTVLRKEMDGYTFVGFAYVHGVMNGEAVKEWKARRKPETVFPIR
jgi:hypothetical protein